jgi:hypothetical protein
MLILPQSSNFMLLRLKTESLQPANPEILDGVDDLMQLSYLTEPSVLYNFAVSIFPCHVGQEVFASLQAERGDGTGGQGNIGTNRIGLNG